jgi:hypothetical protein
MAIFKVWKDGEFEEVIQDSTQFTYIPDGKTKSVSIQRMVYYHNHHFPPSLVISSSGKKYIVPTWTEVHPATQLSDVVWEKPEVKKEVKETKEFRSKSDPTIVYKTIKTTLVTGEQKFWCNCQGRWRAKDGECKHIKEMKSN